MTRSRKDMQASLRMTPSQYAQLERYRARLARQLGLGEVTRSLAIETLLASALARADKD